MNTYKTNWIAGISTAVIAFSGIIQTATAVSVTLQQPTATYSQNFSGVNHSVANAIDGILNNDRGWAVAPSSSGTSIPAQTAAFETAVDIGFVPGSLITFTLLQAHSNPGHNLGRFRLSITTDDRSLFADGLATGGDVTANWVVLNPSSFSSSAGATLTKLGDFSLLASGSNLSPDTYTISAPTSLTGITGIRLEALEDPSLPFSGPGRYGANGNFVVSELTMSIVSVPEPTVLAIFGIGVLVLGMVRRSQRA
jgi:hypothetical protein